MSLGYHGGDGMASIPNVCLMSFSVVFIILFAYEFYLLTFYLPVSIIVCAFGFTFSSLILLILVEATYKKTIGL